MHRRQFLTTASGVFLSFAAGTELLAVSSNGSREISAQIFAQTNAQRRSAGRPALKQAPALMRAAQDYAGTLASAGRLSHSLGGKPGARARSAGFNWRAIGENIAFGNGRGSEADIAAGLVRQWMGSTGHRKNILATKYTMIGVGAVTHNGKAYGVQMFGRPR